MRLQAPSQAIALKAKFFRGFADPSRLRILECLRAGPHTVTAIVEVTALSQSNVSNHLACLLDCGLVTRERQGRYVLYRLSDERVAQLLALAEELLADVAKGVYLCTRYSQKSGQEEPDYAG
ncbi:MAG: transcriptional regulator [Chloroflexota bacterium]